MLRPSATNFDDAFLPLWPLREIRQIDNSMMTLSFHDDTDSPTYAKAKAQADKNLSSIAFILPEIAQLFF
jgi:hypothetical protein